MMPVLLPMRRNRADAGEFVRIAIEALGRYRLRTALSVLGVVLGVAAVIAMMSVGEGASREALAQIESLGLDNLVARSVGGVTAAGTLRQGLTADDAERVAALVPAVTAVSPAVLRYGKVKRAERTMTAPVLGVRPAYQTIRRLVADQGRLLTGTDESAMARACVIGAGAARQLFGYQNPIGEHVRVFEDYYRIVGVLRTHGGAPMPGSTAAGPDVNDAVLVPLPALTGRTMVLAPNQPADELWLRLRDGDRAEVSGELLRRALAQRHAAEAFTVVVPRELLAQRYRTQRTFSIVVGSVAALALLVGGIGIMNIMLTSVVERTREIGVRRTAGATRRHITAQFLVETLMMTIGGGVLGIAAGAGVSVGITSYAGWATHVSTGAILLGVAVSGLVGLVFGIYPAMKAAALEPVDAMRYE